MKIENQVVSLDIAKRLKELGVPQESYFHWSFIDFTQQETSEWQICIGRQDINCFSAYTVAELGELLPFLFKKDDKSFAWNVYPTENKKWESWFEDASYSLVGSKFHADTEANARGLMLIYLLENKLITL